MVANVKQIVGHHNR